MVRAKQARQNECPHGVVTGSNSRLEHRLHSTSSDCSTMRALSHVPAQLSVPELQQALTRTLVQVSAVYTIPPGRRDIAASHRPLDKATSSLSGLRLPSLH